MAWVGFPSSAPELELDFVFVGRNVDDRIYFRLLGGRVVRVVLSPDTKAYVLSGMPTPILNYYCDEYITNWLNFFTDDVSNSGLGQNPLLHRRMWQGTKDPGWQDSMPCFRQPCFCAHQPWASVPISPASVPIPELGMRPSALETMDWSREGVFRGDSNAFIWRLRQSNNVYY